MEIILNDNYTCQCDIHHNNITLKCSIVRLKKPNEISFKDALLLSQNNYNDLNATKIFQSVSNHFITRSQRTNSSHLQPQTQAEIEP